MCIMLFKGKFDSVKLFCEYLKILPVSENINNYNMPSETV